MDGYTRNEKGSPRVRGSRKTLLELEKLVKILSCITSKSFVYEYVGFFPLFQKRKVAPTRNKSQQDDRTSAWKL